MVSPFISCFRVSFLIPLIADKQIRTRAAIRKAKPILTASQEIYSPEVACVYWYQSFSPDTAERVPKVYPTIKRMSSSRKSTHATVHALIPRVYITAYSALLWEIDILKTLDITIIPNKLRRKIIK